MCVEVHTFPYIIPENFGYYNRVFENCHNFVKKCLFLLHTGSRCDKMKEEEKREIPID